MTIHDAIPLFGIIQNAHLPLFVGADKMLRWKYNVFQIQINEVLFAPSYWLPMRYLYIMMATPSLLVQLEERVDIH